MANGIFIKRGKKTYRVVNGKCTKRTCSLFKAGVCDCDGDDHGLQEWLPCGHLMDIADNFAMCPGLCVNFKEVRK